MRTTVTGAKRATLATIRDGMAASKSTAASKAGPTSRTQYHPPHQPPADRVDQRLLTHSERILVVGLILVLLGTSVYLSLSHSLMQRVDPELIARGGQPHPGGHDVYNGGAFTLAIRPNGQLDRKPQQVQLDGASRSSCRRIAWST
jgi:hypothetical protein